MWHTLSMNFINSISAYFLYRTLNLFVPARDFLVFKILAPVALFFFTSTIIYQNDPFPLYVTLIGLPLLMICFFKGSLIQKISTAFIMYPIINTLNFLAEDVGMHIFFQYFGSDFADDILHIVIRSCCAVIYFLIYKLLSARVSGLSETLTLRAWILVDIICSAPMTALLILTLHGHWKSTLTYPIYLTCIITNIACLYLIGFVAEKSRAEMENKNLKLQEDYYEELEQNQMYIRKLNHDMNNHLSVISALWQKGETKKALTFLEDLSVQLEIGSRLFCDNSIVNALINAKYNTAQEKDIDCQFQIDMQGVIPIDDISLCSIFSNTLDNAIEATEKIQDIDQRKIMLKARYTDGYFSYVIENTKINPIQTSKSRFITSKEEKALHGFGLSNIQEIVRKYNGSFDTEYSDDHFSVIILIDTSNAAVK